MPKPRLLAFVIKKLNELLPPTVFFAISFNLLVLTTQLILADYLVHLWNLMLATFFFAQNSTFATSSFWGSGHDHFGMPLSNHRKQIYFKC